MSKDALHDCSYEKLSVICDFQQSGNLTNVDSDELCSLLLSFETQNDVQSVA